MRGSGVEHNTRALEGEVRGLGRVAGVRKLDPP